MFPNIGLKTHSVSTLIINLDNFICPKMGMTHPINAIDLCN